MPLLIPSCLAILLALNAWTMLCFRRDKDNARHGLRRIPEADLLLLAALGGSPGALLARRWFRHKTRKEPFPTRLQLIATAQLGALPGLAWTLIF